MTMLLKTRRKTADQGLEFRTWLRYILKRARRTYKDLAHLSGVPLKTIDSLARGRRKEPTAETRAKLERALYEIDAEFHRLVERAYAQLDQEDGTAIEMDSDNIDAITIRRLIDAYVAFTRRWAEQNGRPWPGPILKTSSWKHDAQRLKEIGIGPDEYEQFFIQAFEHAGIEKKEEQEIDLGKVFKFSFSPNPMIVINRILHRDED